MFHNSVLQFSPVLTEESIAKITKFKLCRLVQFSLNKELQILQYGHYVVEFNHVSFLVYQSFFIVLCYRLCRIVQCSPHKGSQILLKDMVEFNHLSFLSYLTIFHNSVLQVVPASAFHMA